MGRETQDHRAPARMPEELSVRGLVPARSIQEGRDMKQTPEGARLARELDAERIERQRRIAAGLGTSVDRDAELIAEAQDAERDRLTVLYSWQQTALREAGSLLDMTVTADDGRGDPRDIAAGIRSVIDDLAQVAEELDPDPLNGFPVDFTAPGEAEDGHEDTSNPEFRAIVSRLNEDLSEDPVSPGLPGCVREHARDLIAWADRREGLEA